MKGLDNKIEEIIMCLKFRPIKETHDSLRGLVLSEKSQAVQEALQAQRAEIVGECRKIVGKYMPTKKEYIDATDVILMQIIDELEILAKEEVK